MTESDKINDIELIHKFIEEYNRRVDWNRELYANMNIDTFLANPCTCQILDGIVGLEYITPETYELDNARIYACDTQGKYELQVYSYKYYATSYFWVNFNNTKEEYIKSRIQVMRGEVADAIDRFRPELEKLTQNMTALENLQSVLKRYVEERL